MNRKTKQFIANYIVRPPLEVIRAIANALYWLLYGWWGEKRSQRREHERRIQEIRSTFSFLFTKHKGEVIPNTEMSPSGKWRWPIVKVEAEGLLLRFVRWQGDYRVQIRAEHEASDWEDLADLLDLLEPDTRHPFSSFEEAARLLDKYLPLIKDSFSPERYPQTKELIESDNRYKAGLTRLYEKELNRRLYPDS